MFDHCMYFNTAALARRLDREWAEAFAPFGLTPPQGFLLRAIIDRPGLAPARLAAEMSVSRPTVTRALDGLQRLGLIDRRPTAADGRELAVHPTAEGCALRKRLNEASAAVTRRLKRLLGDEAFGDTVSRVAAVRSALG